MTGLSAGFSPARRSRLTGRRKVLNRLLVLGTSAAPPPVPAPRTPGSSSPADVVPVPVGQPVTGKALTASEAARAKGRIARVRAPTGQKAPRPTDSGKRKVSRGFLCRPHDARAPRKARAGVLGRPKLKLNGEALTSATDKAPAVRRGPRVRCVRNDPHSGLGRGSLPTNHKSRQVSQWFPHRLVDISRRSRLGVGTSQFSYEPERQPLLLCCEALAQPIDLERSSRNRIGDACFIVARRRL